MTDDIRLLLNAIRMHPLEHDTRHRFVDLLEEQAPVVRDTIARIMGAEPTLTFTGFNVYIRRGDPEEKIARLFASERERLRRSNRGFALALGWLVSREPLAKPNVRYDSYVMKHDAERELDQGNYVSNGELLTAALYLGIKVRRQPDTPHAFIAVSPAVLGWREYAAAEKEAARIAKQNERAAKAEARRAARESWRRTAWGPRS